MPGNGQDVENLCHSYILENQEKYGLERGDFEEMNLTRSFESKHNKVTHAYFQQRINGIPINESILNFSVRNGRVIYLSSNFKKGIDKISNSNEPSILAKEAVQLALGYLDIYDYGKIISLGRNDDNRQAFQVEHGLEETVQVGLSYQYLNDQLFLAWSLNLVPPGGSENWILRIDAHNGELLKKINRVKSCSWTDQSCSSGQRCSHDLIAIPEEVSSFTSMMNGSYKIFPFPIESPNEGQQAIVDDRIFPSVAPFGWHDTNGVEGPEFTILRGNNVHAYLDEDDNNQPDPFVLDGGPDLQFQYDFITEGEPEEMIELGLTNMFYASNYMHDFAYQFGFDEAAGNFQLNNFGNGGLDGDYVRCEGNDGDGFNNANYLTGVDGERGRMQMFLWNTGQGGKLRIEEPAEFAGVVFETADALGDDGFGGDIDLNPLTAELALTVSAGDSNLACSEVLNSSEVNGKIAIVTRGECDLSEKAYHAEQAGAVAVIYCNTEPGLVNSIGAGAFASQVSIPVVMVTTTACDTLKMILDDGLASIVENPVSLPQQKMGMLDNGVMAHEMAHGFSIRLTGGADTDLCLENDEQMGEGWSDFFAMVVTHKEGDLSSDPRPFASYLLETNQGARRFPYSSDRSINDQTMADIKGTLNSPHMLGEVWAAVLWDFYWYMVEEYGFDPDWTDTESGNWKAVQIVMDALKMQTCEPGFISGRDALFAADQANYNGENECFIWGAFAGRGMGVGATEGSTNNREDNVESFLAPEECSFVNNDPEITNLKEINIFPNPGSDEINVELVNVEGAYLFQIMSNDGRIIESRQMIISNGVRQFNLDISGYAPGMYSIRLVSKTDIIYNRFVKQ